jgi:hypothetical protein
VVFQNYINNILAPYLDCFHTAYLNDTLIYSGNFEEYQQYIYLLLDAFANVGLHLKAKKCEFHQQEVKYLVLIKSIEGIKIDSEKMHAMQDWEPPSNLKDTHVFKICTVQDWEPPSNLKNIYISLGFANFYYYFIYNYSCSI